MKGKDDIVRSAKLKASKSHLKRAAQLLYPLELSCDIEELFKQNDWKIGILRHQSLDLGKGQQRLLERLLERHLFMKTKN